MLLRWGIIFLFPQYANRLMFLPGFVVVVVLTEAILLFLQSWKNVLKFVTQYFFSLENSSYFKMDSGIFHQYLVFLL